MNRLIITELILCVVSAVTFSPQYGMAQNIAPPEDSYFIDSRDGKRYRTVEIGKQTWMAYNLNYKTGNSWCYKYGYTDFDGVCDIYGGDDEKNNCKKFGRLYDWNTAMKVCPNGWHLPSRVEWDNLWLAVGGKKTFDDGTIHWFGVAKKLKSKSGWVNLEDCNTMNGTDNYGFSALPGGYYDPNNTNDGFDGGSETGNWWTATEGDGGAYFWFISYSYDRVGENTWNKSFGLSVRCLKD